jgi:hypothetical protein
MLLPTSGSAGSASSSSPTNAATAADQTALNILPALAFFEAHSAPTFVLPLSAASLRSSTPTQAQEDYLLPDAVWTNAAAAVAPTSPGSWLEHRLDGDGQRAIRGLLLALLWQLEQKDAQLDEETIGRKNGWKRAASAAQTGSSPLLVRCHSEEASDHSKPAWSTYVAAATILPSSPPVSPSYFNGSASHPIGSSTSGNTPTQAGQTTTPMPGDGRQRESPSALVVLQLHPMPEPAVARSVPSQAQRTRSSFKSAPHTPLRDSDRLLNEATGSAYNMRSAHHAPPTVRLGAVDADASVTPPGSHDKSNGPPVRPSPAAAAAAMPLTPIRTETREEKVARRKRKYAMKETVHRLLADEEASPVKKADQTAVFKSALSIVLNTETESTLWWTDKHLAFCACPVAETEPLPEKLSR